MNKTTNNIVKRLKPHAVGNGIPLLNLVQGTLPEQMKLGSSPQKDIINKIQKAIELAIALHIKNRHKIPSKHKLRAEETLKNLFLFQAHLKDNLYMYNASETVTSPEDYLLGFIWPHQIPGFTGSKALGKDPVILNRLYSESVRLLAQDIYHDCIPEHLKIVDGKHGEEVDRTDHKINYQEIQRAIFNETDESGRTIKDEVKELGDFYRNIIDEQVFLHHDIGTVLQTILKKQAKEPADLQPVLQHIMDNTLNPIVLTIVSGVKYITAEANTTSFQMEFTYLQKKAQDDKESDIERTLAYSALYLRNTNYSRTKAISFFETIRNPSAKKIAQETLNNQGHTLCEILFKTRREIFEKKYDYFIQFLSDEKKLKISTDISYSISQIWKNIDQKQPFSDKTQNELKKIVGLDKFLNKNNLTLVAAACYPVCFARLFYEENSGYIINFIKQVRKIPDKDEKMARFREHVLNHPNFLSLYFTSIFLNPKFFLQAKKEQKKRFALGVESLYSPAKQLPDTLLKNGVRIVFDGSNRIEQFVTFYRRTKQYEKALKIVDISIQGSKHIQQLTPSQNHIERIDKLTSEKAAIIKERNKSSVLIAHLKNLLQDPDSIEYNSRINKIIEKISSDTNRTRLDGYNELLRIPNILQSINNNKKIPAFDLVYEEVSSLFEVLYAENHETDVTDLGLCSLLLMHIAYIHTQKKTNQKRIKEIIDTLKKKAKVYNDNGLFTAISNILLIRKQYKEAENFINRIENTVAKAGELQHLAETYLMNGNPQETRRIIDKISDHILILSAQEFPNSCDKRIVSAIKMFTSETLKKLHQMLPETKENQPSPKNLEPDLTYNAELFKYNLTEWRRKHPNEMLLLAFDTDIGQDQKNHLMPVWKIVDEVKKMRDSEGKLLFPKDKFKVIRRDGSTGRLMQEINTFLDNKKVLKQNIFLIGRQTNIKAGQFDSLKGASWITAIDDVLTKDAVYIPVFEALILTMMTAFNADSDSIKRFYDKISYESATLEEIEKMKISQLIYILPKMIKRSPRELKKIYELEFDIYSAV
ncbi:MAG: hypothetical protein ABIH09_02870 [Candidatus Omnitrophota bacterium]